MKDQAEIPGDIDRFMGCFGSFNSENNICLQRCALSLRCAIEKDEYIRLELLEEFLSPDGAILKMQ